MESQCLLAHIQLDGEVFLCSLEKDAECGKLDVDFVAFAVVASMFPREPQTPLPQAGHSCWVPSLGGALVAELVVTGTQGEIQVYHTADSWDSTALGLLPTETAGKLRKVYRVHILAI